MNLNVLLLLSLPKLSTLNLGDYPAVAMLKAFEQALGLKKVSSPGPRKRKEGEDL